jgi:hypothetical protein
VSGLRRRRLSGLYGGSRLRVRSHCRKGQNQERKGNAPEGTRQVRSFLVCEDESLPGASREPD